MLRTLLEHTRRNRLQKWAPLYKGSISDLQRSQSAEVWKANKTVGFQWYSDSPINAVINLLLFGSQFGRGVLGPLQLETKPEIWAIKTNVSSHHIARCLTKSMAPFLIIVLKNLSSFGSSKPQTELGKKSGITANFRTTQITQKVLLNSVTLQFRPNDY